MAERNEAMSDGPHLERLSRLEERVRSLAHSVDELKNSLPTQFLRVEAKVDDAARRDRAEWSQLIDRQRDQFLGILRDERDRAKEDQRERQAAFEKSEAQNSLARQKVDKLWMAVIIVGILLTLLTQASSILKLVLPASPAPAYRQQLPAE